MIRTAPPDGHLRALHAGHAWRGRIAASAAGQRKSLPKQTNGELAERSNAAVLKTVSPRGLGGSNPSLSARTCASKSKDVRQKPISLYENRLSVLTHPNRSGTVLPPSVGRNGGRKWRVRFTACRRSWSRKSSSRAITATAAASTSRSVRRSASRAESDSRILPDPFAVFSGFSGHGRSEKFVLLNPLPGGLERGGMRRTFRRRLEGTFAWLRPVRADNEEIS